MTAEMILDQLESEEEDSNVDEPSEEEPDLEEQAEAQERDDVEEERNDVEETGERKGEKDKEKGEQGDSIFCRDMVLDDDEQEEDEDFDCSFRDPDYREAQDAHLVSSSEEEDLVLEEAFMSGRKRKKGHGASDGTATTGHGGSLARAGQAGGGVGRVAAAHPPPGETGRVGGGRGRGAGGVRARVGQGAWEAQEEGEKGERVEAMPLQGWGGQWG